MAKPRHYIFLLAALVVFFGCGGIRFSHLSPEAQDFHPQSVAILDIGAGGYEVAREAVDRIITDELTAKGWFQKVLSVQAVQGLFKENEVWYDEYGDEFLVVDDISDERVKSMCLRCETLMEEMCLSTMCCRDVRSDGDSFSE